jgi:hypothetical protein
MPRLCERPGCSTPADVAYGFDAEAQVVWLDAFEQAQGQRAGALCRRHADAMVVPLGWMLDDRREPTPRLFNRARMDDLTDGMARPKPRRQRQDRTIELLRSAVLQLTLDELGRDELRAAGSVRELDPTPRSTAGEPQPVTEPQQATPPETTPPETTQPETTPPETSSPEASGPVPSAPTGVELDQSGPMAIVLALVGDETDAAPRPASSADTTGEPEAPDEQGPEVADAQVLPWQPRFDPEDDLKGLLKPRGRLLSRAFRGVAADGA